MRKRLGKRMNKELGGILKAWEATIRKSQAVAKKRAHSFFPAMSVAHAEDDDVGEGCTMKVLSTGDMYNGKWADNLPHGQGKYLWTDGCMYVGEWSRGKIMGKGRFSWPSGATYEGEFKNGFMEGFGIYTGAGGTYKGTWVMNWKDGKGTKNYANGDYYDGEWRKGFQEGQGRYQWSNGNHYVGEWRHGLMNGSGVMVWANGNRYEGFWEDGLPKGEGKFRWEDGSFYEGLWNNDPKQQSGTYHPKESAGGKSDWDPQEVFLVHLSDCKVCPAEVIPVFPSQKMHTWPGSEGDSLHKPPEARRPRRMSLDWRLSNGGGVSSRASNADASCDSVDGYPVAGREGEGLGNDHDDMDSSRGSKGHKVRIPPVRRQGVTICKGHKNYELMLNLQLGIRHSVGKTGPATSLDLKNSAFDPREKVWTKFPPEGSKHTPPHQSCEFRWKDYCPLVFRTLRRLFKVDTADYMISICGDDALRELSSPGKSGSFFYLTNDDKYMIKTLRKAECKVLLKMLPSYYNHVRAFEDTLVTKFFGLHCVKLTGSAQKKVRFVVMGNLFCSEFPIHRRFDLKGSSHGRITDKSDAEIDATTTLKDLDLNFIFRLQKVWFQEFSRQVDKDCDFLEQEGIMDYSLLVGLHFRESTPRSREALSEGRSSGARTPIGNEDPEAEGAAPCLSRADIDQVLSDPVRSSIRLGINMPARVEQTVRSFELQLIGEPTGECYSVILFFGIIDILQDYDISKKLEHAYKSFQFDSTSISAVDPKQYSKRFRDFIFKAFVEDS